MFSRIILSTLLMVPLTLLHLYLFTIKRKESPFWHAFSQQGIGSVVSHLSAALCMSLKVNFKLPTEIV